MLSLSLKLLCAHLMGDFLLQPDKWVQSKEKHKEKSPYLYLHLLIHFLLLVVILQAQKAYWEGILIIIITHGIFDLTKLYLSESKYKNVLFFVDQFLHLAVIAGVVYHYHPYQIEYSLIFSQKFLLFGICLLLVTVVTSIIMRIIISRWEGEIKQTEESLPSAGKYIGILERLFIFGFVVLNFLPGVGFLLAAKSIFRFGDLSKSKDRKLTEYILIGTLLSFGFAILIGLAYKQLTLIGKK